jgi:hypothetical protein
MEKQIYLLSCTFVVQCEFSRNDITDFTAKVRANGGDFSISFWVRPSDETSLQGALFVPQITFYAQLTPPEHNLVLGVYNTHPGGELRLHSPCKSQDSSHMYESIYTSASDVDGWTRFTYIRKNATKHGNNGNTLIQNIKVKGQETTESFCLFNEDRIFSALEVNYPMYISPIQLYPEALRIEQAQLMYYNMMEDMSVRSGPLLPYRKPILIQHIEYAKRSALVTPPVLFQVISMLSVQAP